MMASLIATAIGTAISVAGAITQSQAQARQQSYQSDLAQYQADVQRENSKLAEQQASAERKAGYENMQNERLKTAKLISHQRALAGASGAAVDQGSFEDVAEDTAALREIDAINAYNKGIDAGYNSEIQAWNYRSSAGGYDAQASAYDAASQSTAATGTLAAIGQGIGGIAQMGSTWASFGQGAGGAGGGQYWDRALGKYTSSPVRH
jgi:hypothetical protein